jgi:sigma-B regulation protein RsbU (phosphoserine phosphatase)
MFDQATYDSRRVVIEPGDLLVLFSDGITEAENASGRAFDETGLEAVIATHADHDPEAVGRAILKAVETYTADARLTDDLTALVLKRTGPAEDAKRL